jgi:hypothetical protein
MIAFQKSTLVKKSIEKFCVAEKTTGKRETSQNSPSCYTEGTVIAIARRWVAAPTSVHELSCR